MAVLLLPTPCCWPLVALAMGRGPSRSGAAETLGAFHRIPRRNLGSGLQRALFHRVAQSTVRAPPFPSTDDRLPYVPQDGTVARPAICLQ